MRASPEKFPDIELNDKEQAVAKMLREFEYDEDQIYQVIKEMREWYFMQSQQQQL